MKKDKQLEDRYADAVAVIRQLTGADCAFLFVSNGSAGTGYGLDRKTLKDPKRRRLLAHTLSLIALRLAMMDDEQPEPAPTRWPEPQQQSNDEQLAATRCPNCRDTTTGCDDDELCEGDVAICLGCASPLVVIRQSTGRFGFRIARPDELPTDVRGVLDDLLRRRGQA